MSNTNLVTIDNVRGYIGEGGVAYLNLEDVAKGLGFEKIETKNGKEYKSIRWSRINTYLSSEGFDQKWSKDSYVPENAFYSLCMIADSDTAKKFRRLVCDEILPQIRKNGGYIATKEDDTDEDIMARALIIAQKTIERKAQRIKELEGKVEEDKPKVEYYDKVLDTETCFTVTQIAKELEMSARQLNLILSQMGIQYKQSGQWLLRAEYQDKGYVKTRTHVYKDKDGTMQSKLSTVWTQKGREFLIDLSEDF